jgi:hypothetical protein
VTDSVHEVVAVKVCHSVVVYPFNGGQPPMIMLCPEQVDMVVLVVLLPATCTGMVFLTQRLMTSVTVT